MTTRSVGSKRYEKKLKCLRCGYLWTPKIEFVRVCPNKMCHSLYWATKRKDDVVTCCVCKKKFYPYNHDTIMCSNHCRRKHWEMSENGKLFRSSPITKLKNKMRYTSKKYHETRKKYDRKYLASEKGKEWARRINTTRFLQLKNGKGVKKKEKEEVFKNYNHRCASCGSENNLTLDHIIPLSKGGKHEIDNLQVLCRDCNFKKSDKVILYQAVQ